MTVIAPDQVWLLWTVLLAVAAFGLWAERTPWGARVSGAVLAMGLGFVLSNAGLIPPVAGVYQTVGAYFVPLAIPLLLFRANLRRLPRELPLTVLAFGLGAIGVLLGALAAYYVVQDGARGSQLAASFAAVYIGGPVNAQGVAGTLRIASPLAGGAVAAASLVLTVYLLFLFLLPNWRGLRQGFHEPLTDERWARTDRMVLAERRKGSSMYVAEIAAAFALSAGICAAGFTLEPLLGIDGSALLLIALMAVILATVWPRRIGGLSAAEDLGMMLMYLLFATIGASANIRIVLQAGSMLLWFAVVTVLVHLVFLLAAGKVLRLSLPQLVIGSNANVGGVATAVAMAAARHWRTLEIPAVLCGALGYALAGELAVRLARWLG